MRVNLKVLLTDQSTVVRGKKTLLLGWVRAKVAGVPISL